jgi:hypothetical protein
MLPEGAKAFWENTLVYGVPADEVNTKKGIVRLNDILHAILEYNFPSVHLVVLEQPLQAQ